MRRSDRRGTALAALAIIIAGCADAQIRELAALEGAPLVHVDQAFNWNLALLSNDGLHPTAAGYALVADTFFRARQATLETSPPAAAVLP